MYHGGTGYDEGRITLEPVVVVWPHAGAGSNSRALARGIGAVWKRTGRALRSNRDYRIINWGSTEQPDVLDLVNKYEVLNHWLDVSKAVNKLTALTLMRTAGVRVPEFTTDINIAKGWVTDGRTVIGRSLLRASRGRGITVVRESWPAGYRAPLYTKYMRKDEEYRVHVFGGEVFDAQLKRRRREFDGNVPVGYRARIRSWENGWVFTREGVVLPTHAAEQAIGAVQSLGLAFGAVDLGTREGRTTVYEVNTAPDLQGTTLKKYIEMFSGCTYNRSQKEAA